MTGRYPLQCEEEGCFNPGEPCWYDPTQDEPDAHYCYDHMFDAGFCWGCHTFWGGVESFEFINPNHLCDNCKYDPDYNWELREEYEDDEDSCP